MGIEKPIGVPGPDDPPDALDLSAVSAPGPDQSGRFDAPDVARIDRPLEPSIPNLPAGESEFFNFQPMGLAADQEPKLEGELAMGGTYASAEDQREQFDATVREVAEAGGTVKWSVQPNGDFRVMPASQEGDPDLKHTVLTQGGNAIAVGEARLWVNDEGGISASVSEHSGHYRPDPADGRLAVGAMAFEQYGVTVAELDPYPDPED